MHGLHNIGSILLMLTNSLFGIRLLLAHTAIKAH